jgi:branched-chain amino acid transport system substrate-binding protein
MKKSFLPNLSTTWLFTASLISFGLLAPFSIHAENSPNAPSDTSAHSVQIGFILPLTGKRASIGEDARDGVSLAIQHLKQQGSTNIEAVFEDSQGDPATGVNAYKKLKTQDVKMIVTQNSNISLPILPLANRDDVLQLAISSTSDRYSTPHDLSFRINGPTLYEARYMVDFLSSRFKPSSGRIAVITMEDEYPVSLHKNVIKELTAKGLSPAVKQNFLPNDLDFRALITTLKRKKVTDVILLAYQTQAGFFVKQQKELGLNANTIITCVPVNNIEFFKSAGASNADGTFVTYIKANFHHPAAREFKNKYHKDVNFFSSNGYDAVMVANEALKNCDYQVQTDCLKKEIYKIKNFNGLSGTKGFDDVYGDMSDDYHVMIAKDGTFIPYKAE